jgi:hypothetical protein
MSRQAGQDLAPVGPSSVALTAPEPLIAFQMSDLAEEAGATSVELVETESEAIQAATHESRTSSYLMSG